MRIADIKIEIRMALQDLGRDPHTKLPTRRAALEAMRDVIRIEQAMSAKSNLRDDIKAQRLAHISQHNETPRHRAATSAGR